MKRLDLTINQAVQISKNLTVMLFFYLAAESASGQTSGECLTHECKDHSLVARTEQIINELNLLKTTSEFKTEFQNQFNCTIELFDELNPYYAFTINHQIAREIYDENVNDYDLSQRFFDKVFAFEGEILFNEPKGRNPHVVHLGKDLYIPNENEEDMWFPKSDPIECTNIDFEDQNFSTWQTFCAQVNNTLGATINETAYTPPAACPAPVFGAAQHSIATGGIDPNTGFPRVFPGGGGASALIGDGVGTGSRASVIRRTFAVTSASSVITYSYMAVLEDPGGHTPGEKPFFRTRLFDENGISDPCAEYFAYGGDGQAGWILAGGIQYRNWTTIFIPVDAYIGQNVTIEFAVGDCSQSGHFGYAYIDASCAALEIQQVCEGTSTVLVAPDGGASYLWNTGETTQEITINTAGTYTCTITPVGSNCSVDIVHEAILFPVPVASFNVDQLVICEGGELEITDNSTIDPGGVISTYEWDFGDGITTIPGSGPIGSVPQTTGTYTNPVHTYMAQGNPIIELTVETTDGCTDNFTMPITVTDAPTATIAASQIVCQNDAEPIVTFTGNGTAGPFTFTYNVNGGADEFITTSVGNQSVDISVPTTSSGVFTYNLLHVSDPSSPTCQQDQAGNAVITINPLPTATIDGTTIVCQDDVNPTVTFTGANGSSDYEFAYTLNGGAVQTVVTTGSSTVTLNVPTDTPGNYVYDLVSVQDITTGCGQNQVGQAVIVVNPTPDGTIVGDAVVCQIDVEPMITFTGMDGTSDYIFTYNINGGVAQTISTSGSSTVQINVPTAVSGDFVYTLTNVQDVLTLCEQVLNQSVTVTVNPLPTASISGDVTVCQFDTDPQVTFTGLNGSSEYQFAYNINGGATQTVTTSGSNVVTVDASTATSGTFTYNLISVEDVATGCGQSQTGSTAITVNPMPTATIDGSAHVCQNSGLLPITFTGQNSSSDYVFNYNVDGGATQTVQAIGTNTVIVNVPTDVPGTYQYNLIDVTDPVTGCGQTQVDSEIIEVNPLPYAIISDSEEACYLDPDYPEVVFQGMDGMAPYTFTYTVNGGANQIAISDGLGEFIIVVPTTTVGVNNFNIIKIVEGSALACENSVNESTTVTIHALPNVFAGNDVSICAQEDVVLTATGATSYVWDNGVIDGMPFTPSDTTIYTVIGTDDNGCQNTDQVVVNVVPIPVMNIDPIDIYGCAPVTSTFTNLSTGNLVDCQWYFGDGNVATGCGTISNTFEEAGCYDVTLIVSTPEGCSNTLFMDNLVCVEPNPVASFYADPGSLTSYNWESQMINESSGATSYLWNFGDGSPESTVFSPEHAFPNDEGGIYTVMLVATSDAGCVDTAYVNIQLTEELLVYVPNTFTPDGDNYNEAFKPVFGAGFDPYNYTLLIFNRWGEMVFESHDVDYGWTGMYGIDGNQCQDGTYTWTINVKRRDSGKFVELNGHVNLLK